MSGAERAFQVADLFEMIAAAVPEREAVVCGRRRLTYRGLNERADALAAYLDRGGVGPGAHVAVYLRNGVEHVEALLALFKLRAVPINVNHRYVGPELAYLLQDADAASLLFDASFDDTVAAVAANLSP